MTSHWMCSTSVRGICAACMSGAGGKSAPLLSQQRYTFRNHIEAITLTHPVIVKRWPMTGEYVDYVKHFDCCAFSLSENVGLNLYCGRHIALVCAHRAKLLWRIRQAAFLARCSPGWAASRHGAEAEFACRELGLVQGRGTKNKFLPTPWLAWEELRRPPGCRRYVLRC